MYYPSYIRLITITNNTVQALCDAFDRDPKESSFETCLESLSNLELTEVIALLEAGRLNQKITIPKWRELILEASYDFVCDEREAITNFVYGYPDFSITLNVGWMRYQSFLEKRLKKL